MSWDPSAPGGVTWGNKNWQRVKISSYYYLAASVYAARGEGSTYYVKITGTTSKLSDGPSPIDLYFFVGNDFYTVNSFALSDEKTRYYTGSGGSADSGFTIRAGVSTKNGQASGNTAALISELYIPPFKTYTVTYNANNGTSFSNTATKISGTDFTVTGCPFSYDRYKFTKWNTAADGTGTDYAAGSTYSDNAALTLYAQWEKATVPVYLNPGSDAIESDAIYIRVGDDIIEADAIYIRAGDDIIEV